jgi:radical SAM protein with 4Fe4S-binding SPASM domain
LYDPELNSIIGPEDFYRCGLGSGYGSINYKGDVFACQEVASRQGEKGIFHIGDIYNGINEERIMTLRNNFLNRPVKTFNHVDKDKCLTCPSKLVCNANFCQVNNYILYQNFAEVPDCWCWWNNMLLEKAKFVMEVLGYHQNEFFKRYLLNEISSLGGPLHYGK